MLSVSTGPAGRFGQSYGRPDDTCDGDCPTGYVCPAGTSRLPTMTASATISLTATPSPSVTVTVTPSAVVAAAAKTSVTTLAVAAGGGGGIVFAVFLVVAIIYLNIRRKKHKAVTPAYDNQDGSEADKLGELVMAHMLTCTHEDTHADACAGMRGRGR